MTILIFDLHRGQFDSGGQFDPHSLFAAADEVCNSTVTLLVGVVS